MCVNVSAQSIFVNITKLSFRHSYPAHYVILKRPNCCLLGINPVEKMSHCNDWLSRIRFNIPQLHIYELQSGHRVNLGPEHGGWELVFSGFVYKPLRNGGNRIFRCTMCFFLIKLYCWNNMRLYAHYYVLLGKIYFMSQSVSTLGIGSCTYG